jgi:integrase
MGLDDSLGNRPLRFLGNAEVQSISMLGSFRMQGRRNQSAPNLRLETPLPHHSRTSRILSSGIVEYGFWMRKEGYSETTIEQYVRLLKELSKYGDLQDPESIKVALSPMSWTEATKEMACGACGIYARQHRFAFIAPRYRRVEKLPFIPMESEIDQLIVSMGLKTSTFLSILKDTGTRPLEIWNLKWTDVDYPSSTVTITPLKHSKPRRLKLSSSTIAQLNQLTRPNVNVFGYGGLRTYQHFPRNFELHAIVQQRS